MEASQTPPQDDPQTQQPAADPSDQSNLGSAQPDQPVQTPSETPSEQPPADEQDGSQDPVGTVGETADEGLQPQPDPQEAEELRRRAELEAAADEHRERVTPQRDQPSDHQN